MPGGAVRGEPHPGQALLRRLDRVHPLVADRDAEPADLADRLGHALEQVRVLLDQEPGAPVAARLLVGGEREHDVAGRLAPLAHPLPDDREDHRVHILHVDRAAPPHAPVGDLPGERVERPVAGVGRHHVQVPVDKQGRAAPVRALDPGHQAGALGVRLKHRRLQADLAEQPRHVLRGPPLARPRVVARVGRVDPDQVPADVDNLILSQASEVLSHVPILAPVVWVTHHRLVAGVSSASAGFAGVSGRGSAGGRCVVVWRACGALLPRTDPLRIVARSLLA